MKELKKKSERSKRKERKCTLWDGDRPKPDSQDEGVREEGGGGRHRGEGRDGEAGGREG